MRLNRGFLIQKHLPPALGRFSYPVLDGQEVFLSLVVYAHYDQKAEALAIGSQARVDAVGPQIYPSLII